MSGESGKEKTRRPAALEEQNPNLRSGRFAEALLIASASLLVVAGAWSANFTSYDDTAHISGNPALASNVPLVSYFVPETDRAYFPITMLSWRLDRFLFAGWMPQLLGSWAPGVRTGNALFHALAALVLWRVLLALGLGRGGALFGALAFALHPTACESVCWAVERKNVLAVFFGFSCLWIWLRLEGSAWRRVCLGSLAYALALMSKQSALGIFPVLVLLECFGGRAGLSGAALARNGEKARTGSAARRWGALFPPLVLSAVFVVLGVQGHRSWMAEPPGGSVFTAILTDSWILVRYLVNLVLPARLSAAYGVGAITSLGDGRLWGALLVLALVVGLSLWAARSRKRALFGWLWFAGALGPSLNLVAISYLMQDRYVYLALPGFFLVLTESAVGLWRRFHKEARNPEDPVETDAAAPAFWKIPAPRALWISAALYLALLGALALQRGFVWRTSLEIFADAVEKEPRSAFARYGLGQTNGLVWYAYRNAPDPEKRALAQRHYRSWMRQWEAMFDAVDVDRQLYRAEVALRLGLYYRALGRPDKARRFLRMATETRGGVAAKPAIKAQAEAALREH